MKERHIALLIEDEPEMAAELGSLLESIGHAHVHASSKEEAEQLLAAGTYCYVLLDLQIKACPDSIRAYVEAGQSLLESIRDLYPGRNASGRHGLQVLVVSGHAKEHHYVVKSLQDGADDFIIKPVTQSQPPFRDKVQEALRRSDRLSHTNCSTISDEALKSTVSIAHTTSLLLAITGVPRGKRIEILLNDNRVLLTTVSLRVLLSLVHGRLRDPDGWVHKADLGATTEQGWKGVSRLRDEVAQHMSKGAALIENDAHGSYRLGAAITPVRIEAHAAGLIGDAQLRELARQIEVLLGARAGSPVGLARAQPDGSLTSERSGLT